MSDSPDIDESKAPAKVAGYDQSLSGPSLAASGDEEGQFTVSTAWGDKSKQAVMDIVASHRQATSLSCFDDTTTRTTPEHPVTNEELRLLPKPGDMLFTQSGHEIRVVQDHAGRVLFHLSATEKMLAARLPKQKSSESSIPDSDCAQRKRDRGVTLLTAVDPKNIIELTDNDEEKPGFDVRPATSVPTPKYSFRNHKANKSKLAYDVKYHPMDDDIRPTQAAKRRLAHGEADVLSDDASEDFSVKADSDTDEDSEAPGHEVEGEEHVNQSRRPSRKAKKRLRRQYRPLEPTRRSSRKISEAKISYDMRIHPQDDELEMLTIDTDHEDNHDGTKTCGLPRERNSGCTGVEDVVETDTNTTSSDFECTTGSMNDRVTEEEQKSTEAQAIVTETSPLSTRVATPPLHGTRRKEGLDVWLLEPGDRYFPHDRDSWIPSANSPFQIYTECLEDQLATEAKAASPFSFEHDDKENDTTNTAVEETTIMGAMSILPSTQYRRTSEDRHASRERLMVDGALYDFEHSLSPYGLGGNDGTHEQSERSPSNESVSDILTIVDSSKQLSRGSSVESQANDIDSVLDLEVSDLNLSNSTADDGLRLGLKPCK